MRAGNRCALLTNPPATRAPPARRALQSEPVALARIARSLPALCAAAQAAVPREWVGSYLDATFSAMERMEVRARAFLGRASAARDSCVPARDALLCS